MTDTPMTPEEIIAFELSYKEQQKNYRQHALPPGCYAVSGKALGRLIATVRDREAEIETLQAYAKHEFSLGAEGPSIELQSCRQCLEQAEAERDRLREALTFHLKNIKKWAADVERRGLSNDAARIKSDVAKGLTALTPMEPGDG